MLPVRGRRPLLPFVLTGTKNPHKGPKGTMDRGDHLHAQARRGPDNVKPTEITCSTLSSRHCCRYF